MPAFKRDNASRLRDAERCMKGGAPLTVREAGQARPRQAHQAPRRQERPFRARQRRAAAALPLLVARRAACKAGLFGRLLRLRLRLGDAARDPERGALPGLPRVRLRRTLPRCGARRGHVRRVARRAPVRGGCGDRPAAQAPRALRAARGSRSPPAALARPHALAATATALSLEPFGTVG